MKFTTTLLLAVFCAYFCYVNAIQECYYGVDGSNNPLGTQNCSDITGSCYTNIDTKEGIRMRGCLSYLDTIWWSQTGCSQTIMHGGICYLCDTDLCNDHL